MATIRICDFCNDTLKSGYYFKLIIEKCAPNSAPTPWMHDAISYDICEKCYRKVMEVKKKCAR